jgi:uncharacterized membrane protein YozB (DUF420 family)
MLKVLDGLITAVGVVLTVLGVALALHSLGYANFSSDYGFLKLKQQAVATGWYLPAYYSHVLISSLILMVGFFQVSQIGRKWLSAHRWLGKFYVFGILFLAAPGGLIMSLFINRGPWVLTSFLFQVVFWFVSTAMAYNRIRHRDLEAHREWMLRSFALTCAAITLRAYIFMVSFHYDLNNPTAYAALAWLSWVPNLMIMELYLRYSRTRGSVVKKAGLKRVEVRT